MPKAKAHMEVKPFSQAIHVCHRTFRTSTYIPAHHWHSGRLDVLTCVPWLGRGSLSRCILGILGMNRPCGSRMSGVRCRAQEYTALPVLYASQWFLTCFSCPFPAKFACRVIDVLLQEQRPHVLLRVALAVVAECEADILQLHDCEDIITFLKVCPRLLTCVCASRHTCPVPWVITWDDKVVRLCGPMPPPCVLCNTCVQRGNTFGTLSWLPSR